MLIHQTLNGQASNDDDDDYDCFGEDVGHRHRCRRFAAAYTKYHGITVSSARNVARLTYARSQKGGMYRYVGVKSKGFLFLGIMS